MWFVPIAEELSVGLKSSVEDSPFLLSPHIPECVILFSEAHFCNSKPFFFASIAFTWYQNCTRSWSGCGRSKARGQVRARPHTLSLPCQWIEYTINNISLKCFNGLRYCFMKFRTHILI